MTRREAAWNTVLACFGSSSWLNIITQLSTYLWQFFKGPTPLLAVFGMNSPSVGSQFRPTHVNCLKVSKSGCSPNISPRFWGIWWSTNGFRAIAYRSKPSIRLDVILQLFNHVALPKNGGYTVYTNNVYMCVYVRTYDYVWLCMCMCDYAWLCMVMYVCKIMYVCIYVRTYVCLCMLMCHCVRLCMIMYGYVCM